MNSKIESMITRAVYETNQGSICTELIFEQSESIDAKFLKKEFWDESYGDYVALVEDITKKLKRHFSSASVIPADYTQSGLLELNDRLGKANKGLIEFFNYLLLPRTNYWLDIGSLDHLFAALTNSGLLDLDQPGRYYVP